MRWQGRRQSDNIEDRRGVGGRGLAMGGGLGGAVIVILYLLLGGDPSELSRNLQVHGPSSSSGGGQALSEADKVMGDFVSVVLADLEDVWRVQFQQTGEEYLDLSFFEEMQRKLGAPGDFALAYVIAHEVGHHIQNLRSGSHYFSRSVRCYLDRQVWARRQ